MEKRLRQLSQRLQTLGATIRPNTETQVLAERPRGNEHAASVRIASPNGASTNQSLPPAYTVEIKHVPVFLHIGRVAERINPQLWGKYVSIETFDAIKTREWEKGWEGTIQEKVHFRVAHELAELAGLDLGRFHNILSIEPFQTTPRQGVVRYNLKKAIEGQMRLDEGYLRADAVPGLGISRLACKKTVSFEAGSPWTLPAIAWSLHAVQEYTVLMWLVEYSLNLMLEALREDDSPLGTRLLKHAVSYYERLLHSESPLKTHLEQAPALAKAMNETRSDEDSRHVS